ncbi:CoA transferase, partial [Burkholderia contaminans]
RALLGELGYTPDEARALIEAGVVAGQHGADDAAPGGAPSPNELASA